ncbi:hypothetical protein FPV67DRAFT_1395183, partial [Lyophyllum atratum]
IPVPIGPSIPRRDGIDVQERYARLMVILFKPWRNAMNLRSKNKTWSEAFHELYPSLLLEHKAVIENMQILHECRDSRDDH